MTMFRTVASPLTLLVGNAKVVHFTFPLPSGQPRSLVGQTFIWVARRRLLTTPLIEPVALTLSTDGLYASAPISAEVVAQIADLGAGYLLDWDVIETTNGASTTRWTGQLRVLPSAVTPGETDAAPSWVDLPYAEIISQGETLLISERGAMGPGLEQRLKDLGDIPEADPELARDKIREWGGEGAEPFVGQARDARDGAWQAEGSARAAEGQTRQDRFQTAQDVLAAAAQRAQAEAAAQTALTGANVFASKTAGEAATPNGQFFTAYGPGTNWATRYLMVAGAGVVQDSYPNRAALDAAVSNVGYKITQRAQLQPPGGFEPVLSDDLIWGIPGETSGPAVTRSGSFYARQPHDIGAPFLSDQWKHVWAADSVGNPLIALDRNDTVYVRDSVPFLSDSYAYVIASEDGVIITAVPVEEEASPDPDPDPTTTREWSAVARDGHIWLGAPGTALVRMTDVAGNLTAPQLKGDELSWTDFSSGAGVVTRVTLAATLQYGASITTIAHILASGQSLSRGSALSLPLTSGAPLPGRLMMFQQGVNASAEIALAAGSFTTLASAAVTASEVPAISAGRAFLTDKPATTGVLVSGHGVGGYSYAQLKKGTVPYANMMLAVRTTARKHALAGLGYRLPFLEWTHGEADSGKAKGIYLGYLIEYQANVTADYHSIVSTDAEVVLVSTQVSNFTAYNQVEAPPMTLELLEASILYPAKFLCIGPKYHLPYVDNTHTAAGGSINFGYADGRAMRLYELGLWTGALYMKSGARTNNVAVIDFNQPYGGAPIDLYTGVVSDPGNFGVVFDQVGGNAVTVTNVAQGPGDFQLTVTLSGDPTGTNKRIGVATKGTAGQPAGPTSGGRSCIRSAVAEADPQGRTLDYYACHQFIDIN